MDFFQLVRMAANARFLLQGLVLKLMLCFSVSALNGFWEELSENQSPSADNSNPK